MSAPDRRSGSERDDERVAVPPDDENAGPLSDMIRRFAALGLSTFFTTEGALRKAFGETVPQEWIDFANEQGDRGRQELFDRLAAEMGRILEGMDTEELLDKLMTGRTLEIDARIRIGPRETGEDAPSGTRIDIRTRSD